MKTKKFSKKLKLNKKTIADLPGNEMKGARGGIPYSHPMATRCCIISSPGKPC